MKPLANNRTAKTLLGSLATAALLVTALDVQAAVSQSPLSLTVGVPPNLILTLDDSGSMRESFVPEDSEQLHATRRVKSATFNTMYYDPAITYKLPKKYDAQGNEVGSYTTSFSYAYYNGYKPELGGLDLRNNYKVSWWYKPTAAPSTNFDANDPDYGSGRRQFAQNPIADFTVITGSPQSFTGRNSCTASNGYVILQCESYQAGWSTTRWRGTEALGQDNSKKGVPAYYYEYEEDLAGCSRSIEDDDCYRKVDVSGTAQEQNFAIWYSFYRNRALATLSAARIAFAELSPSVRFTWQSLNECTSLNGTARGCGGDNKFREFSAEQRGRFFSWLDTLPFYSGTPLRGAMSRAGEFLKTDTAWHKYPNATGNNTDNTYACRPSYHVLMTDGIWNGDDRLAAPDRHDGASFTLADGKTFSSSRRPYGDSTSRTLADYAMHYWATDLNPRLNNKLKPYLPYQSGNEETDYWDPRNDPATWQHMVNFTMGLGLTRSLNRSGLQWEGGTHKGTGYQNLLNGTNWPAASADNDNNDNNVYDLWHAAINSRGEFFSVDSPDAMVQAFSDILSRIADRKSSAARPAINSGQLTEDEQIEGRIVTVSYQSSYASDEGWSGDLKRVEKGWSAENNQYETAVVWSAEDKVPGAANRKIYIASETATRGLQAFTAENAGLSNTTDSLAYHLDRDPENGNATDGQWQSRLNYLRGDRSLEDSTMRKRHSVLGDFYASSPVTVSGPRYLLGFANKLEQSHGDNTYTAFAESIATRTPRVYIGGNDGMLHGFNARTGVEEFAFIPTAVFPKLNKLTGRNYSHEFYVDGTPVVADAFDGSQWRTILVGTLRAGGKSVFALDITQPGQEKLLWEFDDSDVPENGVKMGYSFSQPTVARLDDGKWYAVFGNGYDAQGSTDGRAALFIVDAFTGKLKISLEVSGTANVPNGLSTPKLSDYTNDGIAEYAYAGDLQGNLWRFDLPRAITDDEGNTVGVTGFKVGYDEKPMFKALSGSTRQPITAPPSLIKHPTGTGYLVIFGTGKYFEDSDKDGDKSIAQSVYAIWDRETRGEDTDALSRGDLVEQTIETTTSTDGVSARVISSNDVAWMVTDDNDQTTVNKWGWYLDLESGGPPDGEMVIEPMILLGRTLFFQSLIPNTDPCSDGANNWTYAINPYTGGRTAQNAFGLTPVTIDGKTFTVSAIRQDGEGGLSAGQNQDQSFELCTGLACVPVFPDPSSMGRQTWRTVTTQ